MPKRGIDVSEHNGWIDWEKVKPNIDYAMIRAGYGQNNLDVEFKRNADACQRLSIPFGVYWFSYAYTEDMAKREADYVCDAVKGYKLSYPVCFDFEYDSTSYAEKNGVKCTSTLICKLAKAFLKRVTERGYYPMNYSNIDYLDRGFTELLSTYDLWLAQWRVSEPDVICDMWQYAENGRVPGIDGDVDVNYCYVDYPAIIHNSDITYLTDTEKMRIALDLDADWWNEYTEVAYEIIQGKYGNGKERYDAVRKAGYDYDVAQTIVNFILATDRL